MQSSASNAPQTQLLDERCTGILYSTLSQPNAGRLVIIDTKVPGGGKPKEFNFVSMKPLPIMPNEQRIAF